MSQGVWGRYPSISPEKPPLRKVVSFYAGVILGIIGIYGGVAFTLVTCSGWLFLALIPAVPLILWGAVDEHGREYPYAVTSDVD